MPKVPAKAKAAPTPLPRSLVATLPAAAEIVKHLAAINKLVPQLDKQLKASNKKGAIYLAQSFCVFHRLMATIDDCVKPIKGLFETYKVREMPEALESSGVTSIPLDAGYRISVSYSTRASIRPTEKQKAHEWLRENYPDILSETVNASTLSSLARELMEEKNLELPEVLFNVALVPNTSVTATK